MKHVFNSATRKRVTEKKAPCGALSGSFYTMHSKWAVSNIFPLTISFFGFPLSNEHYVSCPK